MQIKIEKLEMALKDKQNCKSENEALKRQVNDLTLKEEVRRKKNNTMPKRKATNSTGTGNHSKATQAEKLNESSDLLSFQAKITLVKK